VNALLLVSMIIGLVAGLAGCRERSPDETPATAPPTAPALDPPSARIWISRTGDIELNGKLVELGAVGAELDELAKRNGVVLYGRDAPDEEPHANGMKVIELVVRNRLPIRMSTRRDFSDATGPDAQLVE
jgi:hypothetical protein